MNPTIELSVRAEGDVADEIIALLGTAGFEGFWEDGEYLRAYIPFSKWDDSVLALTRQSIQSYAATKGIHEPRIFIQTIPPRNWNAQWEESIQPIQVSSRIVIAPSWRPIAVEPGVLLLTIDPKMSFGTGHHETTRMMLTLLETRIREGSTMLDVGTGTGVLAIAAVKLGARRAVGVDIDEWSWENARENIRINGAEGTITVYQGELGDVPPGSFDIVAANIQRSVIEPMLPQLVARIAPDGRLLLAGLLASEAVAMRAAFREERLVIEEECTENEWVAFALRQA